jgi:hypothetical protein
VCTPTPLLMALVVVMQYLPGRSMPKRSRRMLPVPVGIVFATACMVTHPVSAAAGAAKIRVLANAAATMVEAEATVLRTVLTGE